MMVEGSTAPFPDEPAQGVDLACAAGHQQRIFLRGYTREMAIDFAGMLDGTSPMFVHPPREVDSAHTMIGKCTWEGCGAWFRAVPFGYDNN